MKRKNYIGLQLLLVGTLVLTPLLLTSCNDKKVKIDFKDAYATSIMGGIGLLNSAQKPSGEPVAMAEDVFSQNGNLDEQTKETILQNLAIAQSTINGNVVRSEVKPSDRQGYDYFYSISAQNVTGEAQIYYFYYNEQLVRTEKDEGEVEKEYVLDGVAILDGVEYSTYGRREVEEDDVEMEFKISLNEQNFVVIEQEHSAKEIEFEYTLYQDGRKVYQTEVEYEVKRSGVELEFKMQNGGKKTAYKYKFLEKNGREFVIAKEQNTRASSAIAIIEIITDGNGNVTYEFINAI